MLEAISSHLDAIVAMAPTWGLLFVFVFMAVESSFIPFPSEVVMIPAGFLAARGEFTFSSPLLAVVMAVLVGTAGSLAGAYVNYYLACWLGRPFLERYGKYFFIKREALDRSVEIFNRYGAATTFVCRLVPAIRQLISIPAGISRMPFWSFSFFTALGAGIWTAILAAVGYRLGLSAQDMTYQELVLKGKDMVGENVWLIVGGAVLAVVLHLVVSRLVMRSSLAILVAAQLFCMGDGLASDLPTGDDAKRPYEMVWAGRTADENGPALVAFDDPAGWKVTKTRSTFLCRSSRTRPTSAAMVTECWTSRL